MVRFPVDTKPKEGDTVQIQFIPATNVKHPFFWIDNNESIIMIDGDRFQENILPNNVYEITFINITPKQTGHYKVQCESGIQTNSVNLIVVGKL